MYNNAKDLIGKLCDSRFKYFDISTGKYRFKLRPILIIGVEKDRLPCDLTVLPVSKVSKAKNIHGTYDFPLTKEKHSNLNLKYNPSFIRVHKVSTIYSKDVSFDFTNYSLSTLYPEDYESIRELYHVFSKSLF